MSSSAAPTIAPSDSRGDLLSAILAGKKLRRVEASSREDKKKEEVFGAGGGGVAAILARRIAVEGSDSEGESDWTDDEEWD